MIWIWMENHRDRDVLGNADAPYASAVAAQCGTAERYEAVGSPSLPNYLGATSGGTQGVDDDASPASHPLTVDNVFRQVRTTGRAARSYQEGMARPCQLGSSGRYAVKHNPAAYYVGADDRQACEADDLPMGSVAGGAFADDLANDTLPAFAFVTPDLCNDTHDCSVATGDTWLGQWVPAILASRAYQAGRTAVFVVWDEPTPMPFLAIAPTTPAGSTVADRVDHYALLRTTEELLGLPLLGAASQAASMRSALRL